MKEEMGAAPHSDEELRAVTIGELTPLTTRLFLQEYDDSWPRRFEMHAAVLRSALRERAVHVDHVGSTSVPGLAAKPIIDVLLAVADSADESAYVPDLERAGYVLRIREPEWHEHRMLRPADGSANIHVFSMGCPEIRRMLRFRDRLRSDAGDRSIYERAKRELVTRDWRYAQHYADAKSSVIEEILDRTPA